MAARNQPAESVNQETNPTCTHSLGQVMPKPVKIKTLFDRLDTNSDGVLSFDEARACLAGKVPPHKEEEIFAKYDADHNGVLDLKEFTSLCRALDSASFDLKHGGFPSSLSIVDRAWSSEELSESRRRANWVLATFGVAVLTAALLHRRARSA